LKKVRQEIEERVNKQNQKKIPILYFSSKDKDSVFQIKKELEKLSSTIPGKRDIAKARLFIDRVFEIKGSGTVITGTLLNGNLYQNQSVFHFPSLKKIRLRQIESYNATVEKAIIGSRVALNLTGLKKEDIKRGDLIYTHQKISSGYVFDVNIKLIPQKDPLRLKNGTEIEFISHTKILRGIIIFEQNKANLEEEFYAQIRFKEPLCLMLGDCFVIRLPGINETIGGGRILDTLAIKHNFRNLYWEKWLAKRSKLGVRQLILSELERHHKIKKEEFLLDSPYAEQEIYHHLEQLQLEKLLVLKGDWVVELNFWNKATNQFLTFLEQKHENEPLKEGFPIIHFRNKISDMSEDLFLSLINSLSETNKINFKKGIVSSSRYTITLSAQQNKEIEEIIRYIEKDRANLPTEKELKNKFPKNSELIEYLIERGEIIKLEEQIVITPSVYGEMKNKIIDFLRKRQSITIAQVRDLLHISRKYIIPLLTRMDEESITIRKENERFLRK
jgi:selenocysteine-specific elongation factor